MAKARAVVQVGDKRFEMQQFDLPHIGPDDALMRVEACGICGSDVDQYDGKLNGLLSLPMIPGHEPVGIIEEIGDEAARRWGLKAGDRVAVEPTRGCGHCRACKRGDSRNCRTRRAGAKISVCGFIPTTIAPALWGGMAEFMYLDPEVALHKIAPDVPAELVRKHHVHVDRAYVATLQESDLVAGDGGALVTITRKAQVDSNNVIRAQFFDRNADYNQSFASETLAGATALYGPRPQSPKNLQAVQDPIVASMILGIEARRYTLLRNDYKFTAKAGFLMLEAGTLIAVNDSQVGLTNFPVKLTKVTENDNSELECEAEPFVYGCNAPVSLPATAAAMPPGSPGWPLRKPANSTTPITRRMTDSR